MACIEQERSLQMARLEQERSLQVARLEQKRSLQLARLEQEREVAALRLKVEHDQALEREARQLEIARVSREREELKLSVRLDRIRKEAGARRDAIALVASAEENKSQGVRDHELATLATERVSEALKELPLKEARWVSVGPETPAGSLAALITAARELAVGSPDRAA